MGRNSAGNRGSRGSASPSQGSVHIGSNGKVSPAMARVMKENSITFGQMENRDTAKALQKAVSKFATTFGLPEKHIRLANMTGAYGATYPTNDGSAGIYLNRKFFDQPKAKVARLYKSENYSGGGNRAKNRTAQPVSHTITHELGHALWHSMMTTKSGMGANREITKLYKQYIAEKRVKGTGSYSRTTKDEFFAETVASAVHQAGKPNKYVTGIKNIIKKYKLGGK